MSQTSSNIAPHSSTPIASWAAPRLVSSAAPLERRYDAAAPLPAEPYVHPAAVHGTAVVRQRFYPAQLKRIASFDFLSLASGRKQRLIWSGWDRSLPRLYLPFEPLIRLLTEAVDGIMSESAQPSQSSLSTASTSITVRIESPKIANSHVVIAIDSPLWQCDSKFRGAINAGWFRQSSQSHLWQRLAKQCDLVGGWLSVADLPGGGASLYLNLPTDQPRALVSSWLTRQLASSPIQASHRSSNQRVGISLFAIGRSQSETAEQLRAANVRLQSLSSQRDYIYRTCHSRWIWLSLDARLPDFLNTSAWQSQLLDRWQCSSASAAIWEVSGQIEQRFRQMMGTRVPPLDLQTHSAPRGPITSLRPESRVDHAAVAARAHHLPPQSSMRDKAQPAKWRYPI